jgi:hypothetical protein
MAGDEAVPTIENRLRREPQETRERLRQAERLQELPAPGATAHCGSIREYEPPAGLAFHGRHRVQQLPRLRVVQREERELLAAVEPGDDPRRPAAEASLGVVQQDGPAERLNHAPIVLGG